MSPHKYLFVFLICLSNTAHALTLTSGQEHFTTTENITTTDEDGIKSALSGSSGSLNSLTNNHIITTGDSGASSSDYALNITGDYYQITNHNTIQTTGNSGRGISLRDFSEVSNAGSITTQGSTSYGIYTLGDESTIDNSGSITTSGSTSYGVYLNGSSNILTNSGTINTQVYGIYATGDNNHVTNSGTITTSSTAANSSAHGIFMSITSGTGSSITNSGTGLINSISHGIYTKDDDMTITNDGTINSSANDNDYAIKNEGDNVTITNSATGTLNSTSYAIHNSGSNAIINNYGTLNAGIYIGDGTANLFSGSISGDVDGAAHTGSVNIGSDSVTSTFNQTADFIDLDALTIFNGSTLHAYAGIFANTINLDDSGVLTLHDGFALDGQIQGVNSSSGTLNISGTSFTPSTQIGTSSNKIANLNILNDASFTAVHDIYVTDIFIGEGSLNFNQTNNLTVFGNLSGSGFGSINLGSNSQTIDGNFTLTSGDILTTELGENAGNLTVTGAANIDADAHLNIITSPNQGFVTSGKTYTLLTANSGSINAINDANIVVDGIASNRIGLLTYATQANANALTLSITRLEAQEATSNQNAQNIYRNLYTIGGDATDSLSSFQTYLDSTNLSNAHITENLNQLAPQSTKALLATNFNIINQAFNTIDNRLDTAHQGNKNTFKNGLWMQAFNTMASQDASDDDEGYDMDSTGFILAADKTLDNNAILGASLGYVASTIHAADNLKKTQVNSYQLNLYQSWNLDHFFIDGLAGLTWNNYLSDRTITSVNEKAIGDFHGQSYSARLKTGFNQHINKALTITPEITAHFIRSHIDGYSEKGAGSLNLNVQDIHGDFLEARAGLNIGYITTLFALPEFRKIATNLKISYGHSFINDTPITHSNFEGHHTTFNTNISNIDNESLKIGTQIIGHHMDNLTFSADYTMEHKRTYQSHSLALKIRHDF